MLLDYLTKSVDTFPTSDQQATTMAGLTIEHIVYQTWSAREIVVRQGNIFTLQYNDGPVPE